MRDASAVLATAVIIGLCAAGRAADKPNILVIVADDLGYADVGFQGCRDVPTSHLDALASSGVRCTDGYATCPVCSPTRAGLLTGRYQQRFGYEYLGGGGGRTDTGLPPGEKTIADLLRPAGYVTGAIGKWHLGKEETFQPWKRGFDEFYGFLGGGRSYFPTAGRPPVPFAPIDPLVRNGEPADDPPYLTDAFGQEAAAFIDRHAGRPFLLYLAFNAVHVPLQAPDDRLARFSEISHNGRRTYAAMLSAMEDAIGLATAKLREKGNRPQHADRVRQ